MGAFRAPILFPIFEEDSNHKKRPFYFYSAVFLWNKQKGFDIINVIVVEPLNRFGN